MKTNLNVSLISIIAFSILVILSGCVSFLKGEYYLNFEQYESGINAFEQELKKKPDIADNHFYLGRFFLAQKKYKKANTHFQKAVKLEPGSDKYHFWLGVSNGGLNNNQLEMKNYSKTIELNPRHFQAYTYLGHNLFRSKKYMLSLESYNHALSIKSDNPSALYNSALILNRLKRIPEAKSAFKQYLNHYGYGSSSKSKTATAYLNQMGDFEYRAHLLNRRKLVLKKIDFDQLKLKKESRSSLQPIGSMIKKNPKLVLHILAYQKNNKALARKKAGTIKKYLLDMFPEIKPEQIKLSWFGSPERISIGKVNHILDDSINLFAVLK
jgi:tetratricopeptide (TPR) repeat protein